MKKQPLQLKKSEREYLEKLLAKGQLRAKVFKRATALLELDRGKTWEAVATTLTVHRVSVMRWRDSYQQQGLKSLEDAPRSGRPIQIDGTQRAKITALACSEAPPGYARWNLRLLAEKVVELGYCDRISHTQVGNVLKKRTEASSEENVVSRQNQRPLPRSDGADSWVVCTTV
jgi:putative transposase